MKDLIYSFFTIFLGSKLTIFSLHFCQIVLGFLEKERKRKQMRKTTIRHIERILLWIYVTIWSHNLCESVIALGSFTYMPRMFNHWKFILEVVENWCSWHVFLNLNVVIELGWIEKFMRSLHWVLGLLWVSLLGFKMNLWKIVELEELWMGNKKKKVEQVPWNKSVSLTCSPSKKRSPTHYRKDKNFTFSKFNFANNCLGTSLRNRLVPRRWFLNFSQV